MLDRRILDALRENSRASAAAIARHIGASPTTVKRRIEAMHAGGEIRRFTIETADAPKKSVRALVEVFCRGNVSAAELRRLVQQVPDVSLAVTVGGAADVMLMVDGDSAAAISESVERLRSSAKIDRTRTSIVFDDLLG